MDLTISNFPSNINDINGESNTVNFQKVSVKSYATKIFQESTVGILSSIVATGSKYRRFFKISLLSLCLSGFLYQCITFLNHVFEYPETVDIVLERPDNFNIPAFTFCSNNPMKISLFCRKYPDHCFKPSKEFCTKFNSYCGSYETLIPKEKYYKLEESMSREDIIKYGINLNDFLIRNRSWTHDNARPTGPYLRRKYSVDGARICYSLHSVFENNQKPVQITTDEDAGYQFTHRLIFYVDEREMLIPGSHPGVLFLVHSPFEGVNPFKKAIFLKPGINYAIYVEMQEERLLKKPFKTDCRNYEEIWEKNNHTGPRIQSMCEEKCSLDFYTSFFNCVHTSIIYPSKYRICDLNEISHSHTYEASDSLRKCHINCRPDCRSLKYVPEVFERYEVEYHFRNIYKPRAFKNPLMKGNGTFVKGRSPYDTYRYVIVNIFLATKDMQILKHSPKYMNVEVFSAIGGFIGCWLGIALMDILDIFGSVFIVCRYAFRKKCTFKKVSTV